GGARGNAWTPRGLGRGRLLRASRRWGGCGVVPARGHDGPAAGEARRHEGREEGDPRRRAARPPPRGSDLPGSRQEGRDRRRRRDGDPDREDGRGGGGAGRAGARGPCGRRPRGHAPVEVRASRRAGAEAERRHGDRPDALLPRLTHGRLAGDGSAGRCPGRVTISAVPLLLVLLLAVGAATAAGDLPDIQQRGVLRVLVVDGSPEFYA